MNRLFNYHLHVLLLKAERAKEVQSAVSGGVKAHWLEIFSTFKNRLEKEYINTRNSKIYASKLLVSYKFLNDIVKKLTGKTVKAFIDDFVTIEIKRYLVSTSLSVKERLEIIKKKLADIKKLLEEAEKKSQPPKQKYYN